MHSQDEILTWLVAAVAKETGRPAGLIDPDKSIHALGIDSALVISLTFDMEKFFGAELNPIALFEQKSLRAFAERLARYLEERRAAP